MMLRYETGRENEFVSKETMKILIEKELPGVKGFQFEVTDI